MTVASGLAALVVFHGCLSLLSSGDTGTYPFVVQPFSEPIGGCWQTNSNQSQLGQSCCPLTRAETAPFVESGGAVQLEVVAFGEAAFLVEVVADGGVDGGVDGGEFL